MSIVQDRPRPLKIKVTKRIRKVRIPVGSLNLSFFSNVLFRSLLSPSREIVKVISPGNFLFTTPEDVTLTKIYFGQPNPQKTFHKLKQGTHILKLEDTVKLATTPNLIIKNHYRSCAKKHTRFTTTAAAPKYPTYPDVNNLLKVAFDAMTGIIYQDDCQVVTIESEKHYIDYDGNKPGYTDVEISRI